MHPVYLYETGQLRCFGLSQTESVGGEVGVEGLLQKVDFPPSWFDEHKGWVSPAGQKGRQDKRRALGAVAGGTRSRPSLKGQDLGGGGWTGSSESHPSEPRPPQGAGEEPEKKAKNNFFNKKYCKKLNLSLKVFLKNEDF